MKRIVIILFLIVCVSEEVVANEVVIMGESIVEIAQQGESLSRYQVEGTRCHFFIEGTPQGVMISEEGVLHISEQAQEGVITIVAQSKGTKAVKQITLVASWTTKSEHGKQFAVPSLENARHMVIQDSKNFIDYARGLIVTSCFLFLLYFVLISIKKGEK